MLFAPEHQNNILLYMDNLFVTGTDTGVGKTWITLGLMAKWQAAGLAVNGMKPVASGSERKGGRLRNADAVQIMNRCSRPLSYEQVNPYAFADPIAPHIAANKERVVVDLEVLSAAYQAQTSAADRVIVEGVGGWRVPLADGIQTEDLVRRLDLAVVLVVGLRLGCINHALLTAESILAARLSFAGWLANGICRDYTEQQATLDYLCREIPAPFLGNIPWLDRLEPDRIGAAIKVERLDSSKPPQPHA